MACVKQQIPQQFQILQIQQDIKHFSKLPHHLSLFKLITFIQLTIRPPTAIRRPNLPSLMQILEFIRQDLVELIFFYCQTHKHLCFSSRYCFSYSVLLSTSVLREAASLFVNHEVTQSQCNQHPNIYGQENYFTHDYLGPVWSQLGSCSQPRSILRHLLLAGVWQLGWLVYGYNAGRLRQSNSLSCVFSSGFARACSHGIRVSQAAQTTSLMNK